MVQLQLHLAGIEDDRFTRLHISRCDADPVLSAVKTAEVDELGQSFPHGRQIVEAMKSDGKRQRYSRMKVTGASGNARADRPKPSEQVSECRRLGAIEGWKIPEGPEAIKPVLWAIPSNQRGCYGASRPTGEPMQRQGSRFESLIDPRVISGETKPAGEHHGDGLKGTLMPPLLGFIHCFTSISPRVRCRCPFALSDDSAHSSTARMPNQPRQVGKSLDC